MRGKCNLYKTQAELQNSHLIPKFVFDYLKETGGRYFRTYKNPNLRLQDGPKAYLLSEQAEQEFSKRERWFANNIFFPYQKDNKTAFDYDENLAYFMISVLWRVLIDQIEQVSKKNDDLFNFLSDVAEEWRLFLSESKNPKNFDNLSIFLTDRISSHNTTSFNADLYMSRVVDATIITNKTNTSVSIYAKFSRFMIWSIIKGNKTKGENININFNKGKLKLPQIINDDYFGDFIHHRISIIDNVEEVSEKQQEKIIQELSKNENKFWTSDAGQSMINDFIITSKNAEMP